MTRTPTLLVCLGLVLTPACGGSHEHDPDDGHVHADGSTHGPAEGQDAGEEEHEHDEEPLGTATIGTYEVELAQGHGAVTAGKECHLVVKLPFDDGGGTTVRAWIGTEDRNLSLVGLAEYAADHDDYDVHAVAPDPLPDGARWWVEVERPDGTVAVGSAAPITE